MRFTTGNINGFIHRWRAQQIASKKKHSHKEVNIDDDGEKTSIEKQWTPLKVQESKNKRAWPRLHPVARVTPEFPANFSWDDFSDPYWSHMLVSAGKVTKKNNVDSELTDIKNQKPVAGEFNDLKDYLNFAQAYFLWRTELADHFEEENHFEENDTFDKNQAGKFFWNAIDLYA